MTTTVEPPLIVTDPLADVHGGSYLTRDQLQIWRDEYDDDEDQYDDDHWCGARGNSREQSDTWEGSPGTWTCTRSRHPEEWKHMATYGWDERQVIARWGGDVPEVAEEAVEEEKPPVVKVEVGTLYRFRTRKTVLMALGLRAGGRVEVLDLTHQRFRVLNQAQLVERGENDEEPTAEQLAWVTQYMIEAREKTRDVARKQRRGGYFKSADELNRIMRELGLKEFERIRTGRSTVEIGIELSEKDRNEVTNALVEAVRALNLPGIKLGTVSGYTSLEWSEA